MNTFLSPKYQMALIQKIKVAIEFEYPTKQESEFYIKKWHETDGDWNGGWENFGIVYENRSSFSLYQTLQNIDGELLLKIAVDLGIETPDFIPTVATFRNEIKSDYKTASSTFDKAFKQLESHPDIAISLVNSALESILKEIFKDERIQTKPSAGKTLYDLASELLKEFQLFPNSEIPLEIKTIGSSLLAMSKSIEKLRSENTSAHGRTTDDYVVTDPLYAYFIVNAASTIGLFLISYYKMKLPKKVVSQPIEDDLPF